MLRLGTVRDGPRDLDMDDLAGAKRTLPVVARLGLDPDDATAGGQRLRGQRRACQQPASAEADQQQVERPGLLEELLGGRTLPGDDFRMVVGRDQRQPLSSARRRPMASRSSR